MARKKFEEEHENHERWLVSYADFITLLFAFFVVMYAISSLNEGKYRVLSNALGTAFGKAQAIVRPTIESSIRAAVPAIVPKQTAQQKENSELLNREKDKLTGVARDILKALAPLVNQGKVRVTQSSRGISVEINASVLFAPGEAKLTSESGQALNAVAAILKDDPHVIQVEGHTDSIPINTSVFPSNWELSSVRASSVVRLFIADGIPEARLTAVGHGPKFPVASNDTPEGRQRNRRVEVMILARLPEPVTEVPVEKPVSQ
ncbi:MAG TPA: flagellar motor protein MotD [Burkholderiaceae bacterium]|jgi:chemotaxis protein MotB